MAHGHLWLFNMDMCCGMQISSLLVKLRDCKRMGRTTSCVVSPNYPAASNEDYLFDCMNLYARLGDDGTVELSGTVFYWDPVDGDTQKSTTIKTFPDLDDCLSWLGNESAARDKCVEMLDENCQQYEETFIVHCHVALCIWYSGTEHKPHRVIVPIIWVLPVEIIRIIYTVMIQQVLQTHVKSEVTVQRINYAAIRALFFARIDVARVMNMNHGGDSLITCQYSRRGIVPPYYIK